MRNASSVPTCSNCPLALLTIPDNVFDGSIRSEPEPMPHLSAWVWPRDRPYFVLAFRLIRRLSVSLAESVRDVLDQAFPVKHRHDKNSVLLHLVYDSIAVSEPLPDLVIT